MNDRMSRDDRSLDRGQAGQKIDANLVRRLLNAMKAGITLSRDDGPFAEIERALDGHIDERAPRMRLVIIESPLAGNIETNVRYARAALADSFRQGEAPFASHLLYPGTLNDLDPADRKLGMQAGFAWGMVADLTAVYRDLGISPGMKTGIALAEKAGRPVEYRTIPREAWT